MSHPFATTLSRARQQASWIALDVINGSIKTLRDDIKALGGLRGLHVPVEVSSSFSMDVLQEVVVELRDRGYTATVRKMGFFERLVKSWLAGKTNIHPGWEVLVDIRKSPLLAAAVRG